MGTIRGIPQWVLKDTSPEAILAALDDSLTKKRGWVRADEWWVLSHLDEVVKNAQYMALLRADLRRLGWTVVASIDGDWSEVWVDLGSDRSLLFNGGFVAQAGDTGDGEFECFFEDRCGGTVREIVDLFRETYDKEDPDWLSFSEELECLALGVQYAFV